MLNSSDEDSLQRALQSKNLDLSFPLDARIDESLDLCEILGWSAPESDCALK